MDILNCVNRIEAREFTLSEVYAFEDALSIAHPANNNVRAKIRQQLQVFAR
jgi:type II restriction enzyme